MEKMIIDRFEGNKAVCEKADGDMVDVKKEAIPESAREGDCLSFDGSSYSIDIEEMARRSERIAEKMKSVFKD
jgi:hypothetical protein